MKTYRSLPEQLSKLLAEVAKLEQQRSRRYKSWFQRRVSEIVSHKAASWDTAAITPGTEFMRQLSGKVRKVFVEAPPE